MSRGDDLLDGLYVGIVTSNKDPLNMGRIKLRFPWMHDSEESFWSRLVQPYAGKERGLFFMPEVGDEVVVAFELGDIHQPLVIGATWNGEDEPPEPGDPDGRNHHKVIETRFGHKLHFDDTPGEESIQLNDGTLNNIVRWDSKDNSITVTAKTGDVFVKAPKGKISLLAKDIVMLASNNAKRTVGGNEQTTVIDAAAEVESTSKDWKGLTSITGSAQTIQIAAASSMAVSGGSASVSCTNQTDAKIVVEGATTDTASELNLEADNIYEKAASRTWTIADAKLHAPHVALDASGPISLATPLFDCTVEGGQFSMLGDVIDVQAGNMLVKSGQINLNSQTPVPPMPGIKSIARTAARAARTVSN